MRRKFFLVLLFTIVAGIQPALAQSKTEAPAKPAVPEKPVKEAETVININLASDKDFFQALQAAGEVELVDEDSATKSDTKKTATKSDTKKTATKSDNSSTQGK